MTYVEFFDRDAIENVCACLSYAPERVIFVGDNAKLMKRHAENYRRVFDARGYATELQVKGIQKNDLDSAVAVIEELINEYDDLAFGLTGGQELLLVALGMVYGKHPDKVLQLHRFNLRNGTICDIDKDGVTVFCDTPTLSVVENVRIYGGDVVYSGVDGLKTYNWELDSEFAADVETLWQICRRDIKAWNLQVTVFGAIEAVGYPTEDGLTVVATRAEVEHQLAGRGLEITHDQRVINELLDSGLLTYYFQDEDDTQMLITYKDPQIRRCLSKAGQSLEMKIYMTALGATDENNEWVYNDVANGVVIDWDGVIDEAGDGKCDTENEVDVMMMHGTVPVFVSCKNGYVDAEELYKLETVAERFGGKYAKKVLVATSIDALGNAGEYLRQRAKDMNVRLIEGVQDMDDAELTKRIKTLWSN